MILTRVRYLYQQLVDHAHFNLGLKIKVLLNMLNFPLMISSEISILFHKILTVLLKKFQ